VFAILVLPSYLTAAVGFVMLVLVLYPYVYLLARAAFLDVDPLTAADRVAATRPEVPNR
jgi:ABC-type Fe3+ transport system permease subunit